MKVLFDASGDNYSVMRVHAPVGHMLQYSLGPEHNGVPVDIVHYLKGTLTRVGPDGVVEEDHSAGTLIPEFTKIGNYTFVVREEAIWDCISVWAGLESKRISTDFKTDSGEVKGDVFIAEGVWELFGTQHEAPVLLKEVEESVIELVEGPGRLYSNICLKDCNES